MVSVSFLSEHTGELLALVTSCSDGSVSRSNKTNDYLLRGFRPGRKLAQDGCEAEGLGEARFSYIAGVPIYDSPKSIMRKLSSFKSKARALARKALPRVESQAQAQGCLPRWWLEALRVMLCCEIHLIGEGSEDETVLLPRGLLPRAPYRG